MGSYIIAEIGIGPRKITDNQKKIDDFLFSIAELAKKYNEYQKLMEIVVAVHRKLLGRYFLIQN